MGSDQGLWLQRGPGTGDGTLPSDGRFSAGEHTKRRQIESDQKLPYKKKKWRGRVGHNSQTGCQDLSVKDCSTSVFDANAARFVVRMVIVLQQPELQAYTHTSGSEEVNIRVTK